LAYYDIVLISSILAKVIVLKLVMLVLAIVLRLVKLAGPAATAVSVNINLTLL
jgi:hypothetical protein